MKNTISSALLIIAAMIIAFTATFAGGYLQGARSVTEELENLKGKVHQQNAQAEKALVDLTVDRDKKQTALDAQAKQQEETDNAAKLEIARLADELASRRPIRVRVVTEGGACSDSAGGDHTTSATDSAGNSATISRLLPESNSRRLRSAIAEVEKLSAAYNSCRGRLLY